MSTASEGAHTAASLRADQIGSFLPRFHPSRKFTRVLDMIKLHGSANWNYVLTHPCIRFGEADPVVLEFHHIGGKDMAISEMVTGVSGVDRLKEESPKRWRYVRIVIGE